MVDKVIHLRLDYTASLTLSVVANSRREAKAGIFQSPRSVERTKRRYYLTVLLGRQFTEKCILLCVIDNLTLVIPNCCIFNV